MTDTSIDIRVQNIASDPSAEQDALRRGRPDIGALDAFVGLRSLASHGRSYGAKAP